ncbi:MAG TPA: hypothetical protein VFS43_43160 [Polyangiaceae bacterium]|nr:hypothetical protein [Polyangiaceae bacterium]
MGRRIGLYVSWSRPLEAAATLGVLEHRFPALFELRRFAWPHFEQTRERDQGIAGFLEHVVLSGFERCRAVMQEASGADVVLFERTDAAGRACALDDALLDRLDTLVVVGLDNLPTRQLPSVAETVAVRRFLAREGSCLVASPHHTIGAADGPDHLDAHDQARLAVEQAHHGDPLIGGGRQQLGGFVRALLAGVGLPIDNRFGLKPATAPGGAPHPIERADGDERGLLEGVTAFNVHPHLPHFEVPDGVRSQVRVLARQLISPSAPRHPFSEAGHTHFNALLWAPPAGDRRGDVVVGDATLWSSHFGGVEGLQRLWRNVATMEKGPPAR